MRRVLLGLVIGALAFTGGALGGKTVSLFQGWTGGSDVQSNGGSLNLNDGGSLQVSPGSVNLEDDFANPTHGIVVSNSFLRIVKYGPPLARADIVTGSSDPNTGTDVDDPAGSVYLRHAPDGTGSAWIKTTDTTWACFVGCTP